MNYRFIILVSLLLVTSAFGGRKVTTGEVITHEDWRDDFHKRAWGAEISTDYVIENSPSYDAEHDKLPFAPANAVRSARKMLVTLTPSAKDWTFEQFNVVAVEEPFGLVHPRRTGYYIVVFSPPIVEILAGALGDARIVVLFTGEALKPKPQKYSEGPPDVMWELTPKYPRRQPIDKSPEH
jgi:hypothetical protein